jgi:hypothetical protein
MRATCRSQKMLEWRVGYDEVCWWQCSTVNSDATRPSPIQFMWTPLYMVFTATCWVFHWCSNLNSNEVLLWLWLWLCVRTISEVFRDANIANILPSLCQIIHIITTAFLFLSPYCSLNHFRKSYGAPLAVSIRTRTTLGMRSICRLTSCAARCARCCCRLMHSRAVTLHIIRMDLW